MKVHLKERHKTLDLMKYEHLWELSNFEWSEMNKIWAKRAKVAVKCTRKSKIPLQVISENNRAGIPLTYVIRFLVHTERTK